MVALLCARKMSRIQINLCGQWDLSGLLLEWFQVHTLELVSDAANLYLYIGVIDTVIASHTMLARLINSACWENHMLSEHKQPYCRSRRCSSFYFSVFQSSSGIGVLLTLLHFFCSSVQLKEYPQMHSLTQ